MRRSGRLTSAERWELAVFLTVLVLACAGLAAFVNSSGLNRLFAFAFPAQDNTPTLVLDPNPYPAPAQPITQPIVSIAPAPEPAPAIISAAVEKPEAPKKPVVDIKIFNGHKYRYDKTIKLQVTAYAPDIRCCWPYPGTTTASGASVKTNKGKLVASDPNLIPLHSLVAVPGYAGGAAVPVLDTGGAIKGSKLDVLLPTFDQAKDWGSKTLSVKIYKQID